jgi:hypothetical protein
MNEDPSKENETQLLRGRSQITVEIGKKFELI